MTTGSSRRFFVLGLLFADLLAMESSLLVAHTIQKAG